MKIDEIWAIEYDDVKNYLLSEGFREEGDSYVFNSIIVQLSPCDDKSFGLINLKRTHVTIFNKNYDKIDGKEDLRRMENDIDTFYQKFQLRFLKGGG